MIPAIKFDEPKIRKPISVGSSTNIVFDLDTTNEGKQPYTKEKKLFLTERSYGNRRNEVLGLTGLCLNKEPIIEVSSPFDQILNAEDRIVRETINKLRQVISKNYAEAVARRIEQLIQMGYEDEPGRAPINPLSVNNFVNFLENNKHVRQPSIVITPSRNIQAQWGKDFDKKFVVEFLLSNQVSFVLFARDPIKKGKIGRLGGIITTGMLLSVVEPFSVSTWIS